MITEEKLKTFTKGVTKRLSLKGEIKEFQAYKIPISELKYNVKNDRIASFMTQFYEDNEETTMSTEDLNNQIEKFIIESNPDAFKKTKRNIQALGQIEPAVILSDGIVVDGNRRFTVLRQLASETGKSEFNYIEAVWLDRNKYDEKDIKRLELNLQHAAETRLDYNPIDWLVGVYRDLVKSGHLFSLEEYASETQMTKNKLKEDVEVSKLMVEYLEFIKKPEKFHIARKQKIDGPIREVHKILRSNKLDDFDKDDVKEYLFTNILTLDGDLTRIIRNLGAVLGDKEKLDKILDEAEEALDQVYEEVDEQKENDTLISTVDISTDVRQKIQNITERYIEENKIDEAKNEPVESLRLALSHVNKIDTDNIPYFPEEIRENFVDYLIKVENDISEIRKIVDNNAK